MTIHRSRFAWFVLLGCIALCPTASAQKADTAELRKLIDEIATGDAEDARDAADRLIEHVIGPLTEALGSLEKRPLEEQVRIQKALSRVTAVLKIRLVRADLATTDRELFDKLLRDDPELVEHLFDDDPDVRIDAVRRIPLEPNSGAGVALTIKMSDPDYNVAEAAIEAAERLRDPVLLRGLRHFIGEATKVAKSGIYGVNQPDLVLALTQRVRPCVKILGDAQYADALPELLDAMRIFWRRELRNMYEVPIVFDALARIGDERAIPHLLEFINEPELYLTQHIAGNRMAKQTVGDAALLAIIRIYKLKPEDFGFYIDAPPSTFIGFVEQSNRDDAQRALALWRRDNAEKPPAERKPPASQPARR